MALDSGRAPLFGSAWRLTRSDVSCVHFTSSAPIMPTWLLMIVDVGRRLLAGGAAGQFDPLPVRRVAYHVGDPGRVIRCSRSGMNDSRGGPARRRR